jgi:hypothetical protein
VRVKSGQHWDHLIDSDVTSVFLRGISQDVNEEHRYAAADGFYRILHLIPQRAIEKLNNNKVYTDLYNCLQRPNEREWHISILMSYGLIVYRYTYPKIGDRNQPWNEGEFDRFINKIMKESDELSRKLASSLCEKIPMQRLKALFAKLHFINQKELLTSFLVKDQQPQQPIQKNATSKTQKETKPTNTPPKEGMSKDKTPPQMKCNFCGSLKAKVEGANMMVCAR